MEIHGVKNDVVCALEVVPAYVDANGPDYVVPFKEWVASQEICNMCQENVPGPCPHGPEDPAEDE